MTAHRTPLVGENFGTDPKLDRPPALDPLPGVYIRAYRILPRVLRLQQSSRSWLSSPSLRGAGVLPHEPRRSAMSDQNPDSAFDRLVHRALGWLCKPSRARSLRRSA